MLCHDSMYCEVLYDMREEGVLRDTMDMPGQVYPSSIYTVRYNLTCQGSTYCQVKCDMSRQYILPSEM